MKKKNDHQGDCCKVKTRGCINQKVNHINHFVDLESGVSLQKFNHSGDH